MESQAKLANKKFPKKELIVRILTAAVFIIIAILFLLPASYINFGSGTPNNMDAFIKYDYFFLAILGLLLGYIIFEIVNFTSPFKKDRTVFFVNFFYLEIIFLVLYGFIAAYFIIDYNPLWAKPNLEVQDFGYNNDINYLLIYLFFFSMIYLLINVGFSNEIKDSMINLIVSYLGLLFIFSIIFLTICFGFTVILLVILTTTFIDSFAYFGGKLFGKEKIFVNASPNKTYAGFLIGLLSGFLFFLFFYFVFVANMESSNLYWLNDQRYLDLLENNAYLIIDLNVKIVSLMIITIISAPFGDLFFSKIKRNYQQKDFSKILPGHGGLLDRIDSHIFTYTIFSFGLLFIVFI